LLKANGLSSVISASDTFRAAAIEQTVFHAEKLGVKVIKHDYGSDPAAVAFDASNHAKAHGIDVVLIDTAGRQETNLNLLDEMRKINRVVKPDIKIFVGESIAGNALVEQLRVFHQALVLDGVILTKLDCDTKGGVILSITKTLGLPILFVGDGQVYDNLKVFDSKKLLENLFS
ncbi:signal recognition particle-docking protein FtsY, partial [Candidatus Micrarchaeota archaeon]|nr:signal recognition particle-docking protein FtsY [Candidatus Micrarchaeota archaeon]